MKRGREKSRDQTRISAYRLTEVKRLIRDGRYRVAGKALRNAQDDFGWSRKEIVRFFLALKQSHFYKREYAVNCDTDWLDMYKAEMYGQQVYTHFYINDAGQLVIINSFKQDGSKGR
jgi:hypothetical protein